MIFSELYSAYYNAVAAVLRAACDHPLTRGELRRIVADRAFGESVLNIEPALTEGRWPLLRPDGSAVTDFPPTMPLTTLQKRWLKAVALDPRVRLFTDDPPDFPDAEPLFRPEDICVFDRYLDGDPYEDEGYIRRFRVILAAIRDRTPLRIACLDRAGYPTHRTMIPETLEYSEKDDKFRVIGSGYEHGVVVNLGRILALSEAAPLPDRRPDRPRRPEQRELELEVRDRRNALERVMMHFAHFRKEAEKLAADRYRLRIVYDADDETEMVIRVLSFGPTVKVTAPERFAALIRDRILRQKDCGP